MVFAALLDEAGEHLAQCSRNVPMSGALKEQVLVLGRQIAVLRDNVVRHDFHLATPDPAVMSQMARAVMTDSERMTLARAFAERCETLPQRMVEPAAAGMAVEEIAGAVRVLGRSLCQAAWV